MTDLSQDPQLTQSRPSLLENIPIEITVTVGKARPLVRDLLEMSENAVLPLDRRISDPVEIYIGEKLIARGELEEDETGESGALAVRLTEVMLQKADLV
ncbi:FliM/FliN family flagellar motor switch protein [Yoonia sp. 208BN28-4]|uniref:FliM/FliN family flagellar motor switch protein n=1 Tax=Yoonia sp. 208BN28-4 TaxID=3126505 RepID=UPI00309BE09F